MKSITTMLIVYFFAFITVNQSHAQTKSEPAPSGDVVCRFAGVSYPEGTMIKGDRIPEQMCVLAANPSPAGQGHHPEWIRMSKEAQERSSQTITLPAASDKSMNSFCQPTAGKKEGSCGCEGSADVAASAMARSGKGAMQCGQTGWRPLVSCIAQDKEYPEGTVIRAADASEQMCARVVNQPFDPHSRETHLDWVRTSTELRERSARPLTVMLSATCKPAPAKQSGFCGCEGFSDFAPNSVMPSANGPIRCENGEWKPVNKDSAPSRPAEPPLRP